MTDYNVEIYKCISEMLNKFEKFYGYKPDEFIQVDLDLRGHTAGLAYRREMRIRLNVDLLNRYGMEFIKDTLPHEVAHLLADFKARKNGTPLPPAHGVEWNKIMLVLGQEPDRCHSFKTIPARRVTKWAYACSCSVHACSTVMHNRSQKGIFYRCKSCKSVLIWSGKKVTDTNNKKE